MAQASTATRRTGGLGRRRARGEARAPRSRYDAVVIGAGAAGLSAALALKDLGVRPLVLERSDNVAASWRGRYDRLRLNSARRFSHLPDRPFAKGTPTFPTRDQLIAHLEQHSRETGMELLFGAHVERIDRDERGWSPGCEAGPFARGR